MKNIAETIFYVYIYASAFALGALGFTIFTLGVIGFFGVTVGSWAFHFYFGGLAIMFIGAILLYGLHKITSEEEEEVMYTGVLV